MGKKKKNMVQFQVIAGVMDVFRVAMAFLSIVLLMIMLSSLFRWLMKDMELMFSELRVNIGEAIRAVE